MKNLKPSLLIVLLALAQSCSLAESREFPRFLRARGDCGNGTCEPSKGENCVTCPDDCLCGIQYSNVVTRECAEWSTNARFPCTNDDDCGGYCQTDESTTCQSDDECPADGSSKEGTCVTFGSCRSIELACMPRSPKEFSSCSRDQDCGGFCSYSSQNPDSPCMSDDDCPVSEIEISRGFEGRCITFANCRQGVPIKVTAPGATTSAPIPAVTSAPTPAPTSARTPSPTPPPTVALTSAPVDEGDPIPFVKSWCGTTRSIGPFGTTRLFFCYEERHDQHMDLYVPNNPSASRIPIIMLVHGSLKSIGYDTEDDIKDVCTNIVSRSNGRLACATIEYRQSGVTGGSCNMPGKDAYRDQLADVAKALNFLQYYASDYGLDPNEMYIGGHNMGALLANLLNMRFEEFCPGCRDLVGVVGMGGIYDVGTWFKHDMETFRGENRCDTRRKFSYQDNVNTCADPTYSISCWKAGSPRYLAANRATLGVSLSTNNILAIHSSGDEVVPSVQATNFKSAFGTNGANVITSTDGTCATGLHYQFVSETELADCMINFISSGGTSIN